MERLCQLPRLWQSLRTNRSGISIVEFALVLPVLLTLGLYGTEIARMATINMTVSQIALSVADNASRLGQTDNAAVAPTITEGNVDAVLAGALRDGQSIGLEANGRIILSSLEYDDFTDSQFIAWQRCRGNREFDSAYGNDTTDNGLNGSPIAGMGAGTTQITAQTGQAVMFVEIEYAYQALFENPFGSGDKILRKEAAFLIRDDRNLEPGLTGGSSGSSCSS
ncbi:pilus assembly protein [Pontixanthobacter aestiaquae]|uniref:Pilus assembly protein TadE n=1 Tax=Pontixanthobacter aestiaquae TaxID=1509367 RepID=A0A844ZCU3_9SPHN|nr:TadE family protein [Pontixanthobacter aestiaquae]MDN3645370.1 pilus assembly protein [Pontixanthobacter aestiaquae]MXO83629.1 pilus assembly protein TadE [Pontixanthobacter aestiaquae]